MSIYPRSHGLGWNENINQAELPPDIMTPPPPPSSSPSRPISSMADLERLLACELCANIFDKPVTLPCGRSLCQTCLPPSHTRLYISYPDDLRRRTAIVCPFEGCHLDHCCADINRDFVLQAVIENAFAGRQHPKLVERARKQSSDSDTNGLSPAQVAENIPDDKLPIQILPDLTCLVCHSLFTSPITTACGHTFCKPCLLQTSQSLASCPICRHILAPTTTLARQNENKLVSQLLQLFSSAPSYLLPLSANEYNFIDTMVADVPLFVCTLSFPQMPTYLHIFEPRYRLMLARVLQSSPPCFGMLGYHRSVHPGSKQNTEYVLIGTMLEVISVQMTPDGRSVVETSGQWRFSVESASRHQDGYLTGTVKRLDDVSIAEEEVLESSERQSQPHFSEISEKLSEKAGSDVNSVKSSSTTSSSTPDGSPFSLHTPLSSLSTLDLLALCTSFIGAMQLRSAPWLHRSVLSGVGPMPADPAAFTWWFASVIPVSEAEKYRLLELTSVRERLKVCAGWARAAKHVERGRGDMCCMM